MKPKSTKKRKSNQPKVQRRNILTTSQLEEKVPLSKIKKAVLNEGLKLSWIRFIDEYIANGGNGTQAYFKVYNTKDHPIKESTARVEASRLLRNPNILSELNNKLQASRITPEFIRQQLLEIGSDNKDNPKALNAVVKSYELLAKMEGLLVDTKKMIFDEKNPAVFVKGYDSKEKKSFDKVRDNKERIVE